MAFTTIAAAAAATIYHGGDLMCLQMVCCNRRACINLAVSFSSVPGPFLPTLGPERILGLAASGVRALAKPQTFVRLWLGLWAS